MNKATQALGRRLRQERERLGISLEAIAESTKIKRSLLADLERGDASRWPPGIYGRAFVRHYALAIGLPADRVLSEFLEVFPEKGAPSPPPVQPQASELRMTFASDPHEAVLATLLRVALAVAELCSILALGWLLARLAGWDFWRTSGALALVYYPVVAVCATRAAAFRWPRFSPTLPFARDAVHMMLNRAPVRSAGERAV